MNLESPLERLARLRPLLHTRRQLIASGHTEGRIRTAVGAGELLRILHGRYVSLDDWKHLDPVDRHLLRTLAVERGAGSPPLFSHTTAALLHGLPVLRLDTHRVHLLAPHTPSTRPRRPDRARSEAAATVIRHNRLPDPGCIRATTGGLDHTELIHTVLDIAQSAPFDVGLVCADAALRKVVRLHGMPEEAARSAALTALEARPRCPGKGRARHVLNFASGLAESPLETLVRLQLARLGIAVGEQVEVSGPSGQTYRIDFELYGYAAFFEADGAAKYLDARLRPGESAGQAVLREKRREDWIRGSTRKTILRGGWGDAQSPRTMGALLRAYGIAPPSPDGLARMDLY